jgi:shikimate dehydrogenase
MAYNPGSAFAADLIGKQAWAFDAVYTPTDTQFLTDCSHAGLATLTGFDLFRHMAIRSFQTYTGISPNPNVTLSNLAVLRPD